MSYINQLRNANYCKYKCLPAIDIPRDPSIPAFIQNPGLQQIKIQRGYGGTPQFRSFAINQFGRYLGTGGQSPKNFS